MDERSEDTQTLDNAHRNVTPEEMSTASTTDALQEIRQLIAAEDLATAIARCSALGQKEPLDSRVWRLAADISVRLNRLHDAFDFLTRAISCGPKDASLILSYGQLLLRLGRRSDALAVAREAEDYFLPPALHDALGTLLTLLENPTRALQHFEHAVQAVPKSIDYRFNLAMAQRMVGDFETAETNLDAVIEVRPNDAEAYSTRSELRGQTPDRNHVAQLQAALGRSTDTRSSVAIEFALAKELEDLAEYPRSFSHLSHACRSYRASIRYDVTEDVAVLDALRKTHTSARLASVVPGLDTNECIFIVGLPRSGTTLVERILGTHSQVYAAGELNALPSAAIAAVAKRSGGPVKKLQFVEAALDVQMADVCHDYLREVRARIGNTPKCADKTPLNYLYAGIIHAALPRARFIALRRHPMDSGYAMFKTRFAGAYPFSYDLSEIASYYVAWRQLMRHWETTIGDAWLTVDYEDLVTNQEKVSRRILAHCELSWEEQCLEFHRSRTAVTTASAAQVRRKMYPDSIRRWRSYATELEPLARYLEANGVSTQ